jgi:hypothetical protein
MDSPTRSSSSSTAAAPKAGQKQFISSLSLSSTSFGGGDPLAARLAASAAAAFSQPDPDADEDEDSDDGGDDGGQGVRRHRILSGAGRPKAGDIDSEVGFAHSSDSDLLPNPLLSQLRFVPSQPRHIDCSFLPDSICVLC